MSGDPRLTASRPAARVKQGMSLSLLRLRAWVALIAFSGTFGFGLLSLGHFGADDDAACGQPGPRSGHSRAQFEVVKLASQATHCPFCHWQRTVSGARVALAGASAVRLSPVDSLQHALTHHPTSPIADPHLSRGPPDDPQAA